MNRISVRLLAFNLLVVFVPVVAFLSLGTYERQLLASQERALVQQARLLAASLEDTGAGMAVEAQRVLIALRQRSDARLRVVGADGRLLVDSARFGPRAADRAADAAGRSGEADGTDGSARDSSASAEETFLYRLASFPVRLWRRWAGPPRPPLETDDFYAGADALLGSEVRAALDGRYGAATRVSAKRSRAPRSRSRRACGAPRAGSTRRRWSSFPKRPCRPAGACAPRLTCPASRGSTSPSRWSRRRTPWTSGSSSPRTTPRTGSRA